MRWPWMRGEDEVETLAAEPLGVIELDAAGPLAGPRRRPDDELREVPDRPGAADPAGIAGFWEALAHS